MSTHRFSSAVLAIGLLSVVLNGCKKATPAPPPPPPPKANVTEVKPAERPTIAVFVAEPSTIVSGNPSTLRWAVSGATDISIDQGIGSVPASGTRVVYPSNDATYTLVARGVGGVTESRVRVAVTSPTTVREPPKDPAPVTTKKTITELLAQDIRDAYFDFDSFDVRDDARNVLSSNGETLKRVFGDSFYGSAAVTIEGHCDERGSDAYNVALGDRRAQAALEFLKGLGVNGERLKTTSYGKERPACTDATEECWQRNRRVHFAGQ
jgi:peptidoglycan-associated lipoprotein